MRVAIIYSTNSGSTYQAATMIADVLEKRKYDVALKRADQADAHTLDQADLILLGSGTWEWVQEGKPRLEGQLQDLMRNFLARLDARKYAGQKFAIFACGDSSYTSFAAAADHLEAFVKQAGGQLICPSLRLDQFYFHLEKNRQRVVDWAEKIA